MPELGNQNYLGFLGEFGVSPELRTTSLRAEVTRAPADSMSQPNRESALILIPHPVGGEVGGGVSGTLKDVLVQIQGDRETSRQRPH